MTAPLHAPRPRPHWAIRRADTPTLMRNNTVLATASPAMRHLPSVRLWRAYSSGGATLTAIAATICMRVSTYSSLAPRTSHPSPALLPSLSVVFQMSLLVPFQPSSLPSYRPLLASIFRLPPSTSLVSYSTILSLLVSASSHSCLLPSLSSSSFSYPPSSFSYPPSPFSSTRPPSAYLPPSPSSLFSASSPTSPPSRFLRVTWAGFIPVVDMQMAVYVARRRPLVSFRGAESLVGWGPGRGCGSFFASRVLFVQIFLWACWGGTVCGVLFRLASLQAMSFVYSAPLVLYHMDTPIRVRGGGLRST
ncbi:hypothetical protein DFH08DRAFT_1012282, partial [Mycena albidolilacea]